MTIFFAALHHLAVLTLFVCALLVIRHLNQPFTLSGARLLSKLDMVNGTAATLALVVGLMRVFYFEKSSTYYFDNGPFLAKLAFYGLATVLSMVFTLEVYRWRIPLKNGQLPSLNAGKIATLRTIASLQLVCLVSMAMCATLAARGSNLYPF